MAGSGTAKVNHLPNIVQVACPVHNTVESPSIPSFLNCRFHLSFLLFSSLIFLHGHSGKNTCSLVPSHVLYVIATKIRFELCQCTRKRTTTRHYHHYPHRLPSAHVQPGCGCFACRSTPSVSSATSLSVKASTELGAAWQVLARWPAKLRCAAGKPAAAGSLSPSGRLPQVPGKSGAGIASTSSVAGGEIARNHATNAPPPRKRGKDFHVHFYKKR